MNTGRNDAISSPRNPRIRSVMHLQKKRERDRTGLMLIEGIREISSALAGGIELNEVFICPDINKSKAGSDLLDELDRVKAKLTPVGRRVFEKISYRKSTGGLVAVAKKPDFSMAGLAVDDNPLILVVDAVEKPGNLGAILRSADGAGIGGLIVSNPGTDISNPNVIRASLGTLFTVRVAVATPEEAIGWLKGNKIKIITSTPEGETLYTEADMTSPCAIVVGSEDTGACLSWIEYSDTLVRIPMKGRGDSLNVSTSAAILLYEAQRQRMKSGRNK